MAKHGNQFKFKYWHVIFVSKIEQKLKKKAMCAQCLILPIVCSDKGKSWNWIKR